MTDFKTGDRVKLSARGLEMFPEWTDVGVGEVLGKEDVYLKVRFDKHPLTHNDPAYHLPDELELVKDELLPIGTRVRCINHTDYHGKVGTIVSYSTPYFPDCPYRIKWDGIDDEPVGNNQGGPWSRESIEVVTSGSREQKLEGAVMLAAYIFEEYHRQHLEKEMSPATILKAMANRALADIMYDALDAD